MFSIIIADFKNKKKCIIYIILIILYIFFQYCNYKYDNYKKMINFNSDDYKILVSYYYDDELLNTLSNYRIADYLIIYTSDFQEAYDLYEKLNKKGYQVFFANIEAQKNVEKYFENMKIIKNYRIIINIVIILISIILMIIYILLSKKEFFVFKVIGLNCCQISCIYFFRFLILSFICLLIHFTFYLF